MDREKFAFLISTPWRRIMDRHPADSGEFLLLKFMRKADAPGYWVATSDCRRVYFYGAENQEDVLRDGLEVLGIVQDGAAECLSLLDKLLSTGFYEDFRIDGGVMKLRVSIEVEGMIFSKQYVLTELEDLGLGNYDGRDAADITKECLAIPAMKTITTLATEVERLVEIIRAKEREIDLRKIIPEQDMRQAHITEIMNYDRLQAEVLNAAKASNFATEPLRVWSSTNEVIGASDGPLERSDTLAEEAGTFKPKTFFASPSSAATTATRSGVESLRTVPVDSCSEAQQTPTIPAISEPSIRKKHKKKLRF